MMKLFVRDNRAVCPSCSGLITTRQNFYFCNDCRAAYIGKGEGRTEGEVIIDTAEKWQVEMDKEKGLIDYLDKLDAMIKPLEDEYKRTAEELMKMGA